jgi:acyl dehydratase
MSTIEVGLDRIGRWTETTRFVVDAAGVIAYAAATNDRHPLHTGGIVAPPLFAVVPVGEHIARALDGMIALEDRSWALHAEQDMVFHGPIVPGMTLHTRAVPIGVQPRIHGTSVVIKTETTEDGGPLVTEQYVTLLFRRKFAGPAAGDGAPDHRTAPEARASAKTLGLVLTATDTLDDDQTVRYAEASGDRNAIHLDPKFAAAVGLPGIIVHGMCTLAFAGRALIETVCGNVPRRLRRLAVRFARPVLPGQTITTHVWPAGERAGRALHAFETLNPDAKAVLLDGLAEVERSEVTPGGAG